MSRLLPRTTPPFPLIYKGGGWWSKQAMSNHLPWRVSYGLQGRPLAIASQYLPLTHHPSCLTAGVKGRRLDDTIAYKLGGLVDKKYKRQEMVRTREYTGKNPALVGGFNQVNRSQRTRWIGKSFLGYSTGLQRLCSWIYLR